MRKQYWAIANAVRVYFQTFSCWKLDTSSIIEIFLGWNHINALFTNGHLFLIFQYREIDVIIQLDSESQIAALAILGEIYFRHGVFAQILEN